MLKAVRHGVLQIGNGLIFIEIDEVLASPMWKNWKWMIDAIGSRIRPGVRIGLGTQTEGTRRIQPGRTAVCQHRLERISVIHGSSQSRVGRTIFHDERIDIIVINELTAAVAGKLAQRCVSNTRHEKIAIEFPKPARGLSRFREFVNNDTGDRTQARPRNCFDNRARLMHDDTHFRHLFNEVRVGGPIDVDDCLNRYARFEHIEGNVVTFGIGGRDDSLRSWADAVKLHQALHAGCR